MPPLANTAWDGTLVEARDLVPSIREARELLYVSLKSTWYYEIDSTVLMFYYVATLCDPRFVGLAIPLFTNDMCETAFAAFKEQYDLHYAPIVEHECNDRNEPDLDSDTDDDVTKDDVMCSQEDVVQSSQPRPPARAGSFLDFVSSLQHLTGSSEPLRPPASETIHKSEAELWLEMEPAPMTTDPLDWWGDNEYRFPNLRRMAQQYLMVPATSASAERVFSLAGRLFSDLRQHMNDGTPEERMWAKVNLSNPVEGAAATCY